MKKKPIIAAGAVIALVAAAVMLYIYPEMHDKECRERVFGDMQSKVDEVSTSVVGLFQKTEGSDGSVTYSGNASGVIFERDGNRYYAATAAHAVNGKDAAFRVYTAKTEIKRISDPALASIGLEVVDSSFYEGLSDVKVEYISPDADLAVVSFESEDELTVTYGTVTSELKDISITDRDTGATSENRRLPKFDAGLQAKFTSLYATSRRIDVIFDDVGNHDGELASR